MKYTVTVKIAYVQEVEIDADDVDDARRTAIDQFDPAEAEVFSVDVYGLDPWQPTNNDEDYAHETARQREIDNENS